MAKAMHDRIERSLHEATAHYHRLVLLVGEAGIGKTAALRSLSEKLDADVINVNLMLSAKLIELTKRQRVLQLSTLLGEMLDDVGPVALLDNTEILFDRELKQDPLRLLQSLSRTCSIVASWNGRLVDDKLTYAEIGHPQYLTYDRRNIFIVDMNTPPVYCSRERQKA